MNTVAFYDTKPYDREYFERAPEASRLHRQFHEFPLSTEIAPPWAARAVSMLGTGKAFLTGTTL